DVVRFARYSFSDVVLRQVNPKVFKDKIVLVGGTLKGAFDFTAVPNVNTFPGLVVQATALANLIGEMDFRPPDPGGVFLLVIILGLGCGLLMTHAPTWAGAMTVISWVVGYFIFCQYAFSQRNLLLEYVTPTLSFLSVYVITLFHGLVVEEKEKRRIKET